MTDFEGWTATPDRIVMPWLERPNCQFGGIGGCNNPATRLVGFERSGRWFFSCARHAEWWRNRGGYWVGDLMGRCGDAAVSEELLSYLRDEYDDKSCVCGAPDRYKDHDCPAGH